MKKIIYAVLYIAVLLTLYKTVSIQLNDRQKLFFSTIDKNYYHFLDMYELFIRLNNEQVISLSDFHILMKSTQDAYYDFAFILDKKNIIQSSRRNPDTLDIDSLWEDIRPMLDNPSVFFTDTVKKDGKLYIIGIRKVDISDATIHLCIISDQTDTEMSWIYWKNTSFFIYVIIWTIISIALLFFINSTSKQQKSLPAYKTDEFLKSLFTDNESFTMIIDANQEIEFISTNLLNVLKYSEKDVVGKPASRFLMNIEQNEYSFLSSKMNANVQYEVHLIDFAGQKRTFLMSVFQVLDEKKNLKNTLLVFQLIEFFEESNNEMQEKINKGKYLTALTNLINSSTDLDKILEFVASETKKFVDFDFFTLYEVRDNKLYLTFSTDPEFKIRSNVMGKAMGEGLTGMVAKIGQSILVNNTKMSHIPQKVEGTADDDECCISTPIINDNKVYAVTLVSRQSLVFFTDADQKTLEELFNYLVVRFEKNSLQDKIDHANQRYDSILNESVLGVLILYENRIIFSNRKMLEYLDYNEKYMLNRDIFSIIEGSSKSMFMAQLTSFQFNSNLSTFEITLKNTENKEVIFEMNLSSIEWKGQNCILIIANNITKRVELNNHLLQAQKLESLGALTSGIAHDFKNILAGIMGAADLLMLKSQETSQTYNYAKVIKSSASRGASLSQQLLNFSSTRKIKEEIFNLNDVLHETIQIITYTFNKNIILQYDFSEDKLFFEGDVVKIQQCILNLCVNARDAMPDGGTLTIRTKFIRDVEEIAYLWAEAENRAYSYIEITDTGSGISEAHLPSIFDAFFTTKEKNKGTGLGLATTSQIVKEYNGYITLTSKVGVGTSFYIFLPWIEKLGEVEATTDTDKKNKTHNILLVDDELIILDVAKELLEELGCTVHATDDGYEALQMLKENPDITLAIIDRIMPKMDGFTLLKKIKEQKPEVKVVFASGFVQESDAIEFKNHGATKFIQKPYKLEDLVNLLNTV